jgi:hypothetical protein
MVFINGLEQSNYHELGHLAKQQTIIKEHGPLAFIICDGVIFSALMV